MKKPFEAISLSKLKFEKKEVDLITNDMQKMIDFIQTLEEINTDGVGTIHMTEGYNNWRKMKLKKCWIKRSTKWTSIGFHLLLKFQSSR